MPKINHSNATLTDYLAGVYGPGWRVIDDSMAACVIARGPICADRPEYGDQIGRFSRHSSTARFHRADDQQSAA